MQLIHHFLEQRSGMEWASLFANIFSLPWSCEKTGGPNAELQWSFSISIFWLLNLDWDARLSKGWSAGSRSFVGPWCTALVTFWGINCINMHNSIPFVYMAWWCWSDAAMSSPSQKQSSLAWLTAARAGEDNLSISPSKALVFLRWGREWWVWC